MRPLFDAWQRGDARALPPAPATCAALWDQFIGGLAPFDRTLPTALILATTKGDIDAHVAWMRSDHQAGAATRPPSLGEQARALAGRLGLSGPAWAVSTACSSGITALVDGALALAQPDLAQVLVVGMDLAGDFVRDGFAALKAISPAGLCRPFDRGRDGLMLGTAACAALLTRRPAAPGATRILGFGIASDAVHMTAPDRHAGGLIRALAQALLAADLHPRDIDAVLAHGTGTKYNDAMELTAFDHVFSSQGARPAVTAAKGLLGHTLGASGVIESLLAGEMLRTGTLPAITHLREPDSSSVDLVTHLRTRPLRHVLKTASGFGGTNAAILLSREDA